MKLKKQNSAAILRVKLKQEREEYKQLLYAKIETENYNQWVRDTKVAIDKINARIRSTN